MELPFGLAKLTPSSAFSSSKAVGLPKVPVVENFSGEDSLNRSGSEAQSCLDPGESGGSSEDAVQVKVRDQVIVLHFFF